MVCDLPQLLDIVFIGGDIMDLKLIETLLIEKIKTEVANDPDFKDASCELFLLISEISAMVFRKFLELIPPE